MLGGLFIKFDVSLYGEAECCTPAIKVGNLTGKARIPVLSTWSLGGESFLEKAAQCTTFCFNTSLAEMPSPAEDYETSCHLSSVPKARQWKYSQNPAFNRCISVQGVFAGTDVS